METKNISTKKAAYTVTTEKTKCDGKKFKGFIYTVEITDGKNTASFISNGEKNLDFEKLGSATNERGAKFIKGSGKTLYLMPNWNKGGNISEQTARMLDFVNKVLTINVKFAVDGVLIYKA